MRHATQNRGGPRAAAGPEAPPVTAGEKPVVSSPGGTPPPALQIHDLVEGSGVEAVAGAVVSVHYVGVAWSTDEQFDASWDHGQPLSFALGAGQVIRGWDGERGAGGVIGPNETLIFVVDLLDVQIPD